MNRGLAIIASCILLLATLLLSNGCNLSKRAEVIPSTTPPASDTPTTKPNSPPSSAIIEPTNRSVTERLILQNYPTASAVVISPDGRRTAYFSGQSIVVDGVESKLNHRPIPNSLVFSPDSKRLAYAALKDDKYIVVADGVEGKQYEGGAVYRTPPVPRFSPDSQHLVYAAIAWEDLYKPFIVIDGVDGDAISSDFVYTPDGKHLAYAVTVSNTIKATVKDGNVVVTGERAGVRVMVDGIGGKRYDRIQPDSLVLSPDGNRIAYVVETDKKFVVVDGIEGEQYFAVKYLVFSPDGKRFAYWGQNVEFSMVGGAVDQKNFVVVDGVARPTPYSLSCIQSLFFTPDSQHVAFFTPSSLVVDGTETKIDTPASISSFPPVLSPDGKRLANVTFRKDESSGKLMGFVVVDGKPGKEYDGGAGYFALTSAVFSSDSQHVAYPVHENQGKRAFVVVDGIEGRVYDSVSKLGFDSPDRLRYNAVKGGSLYLVEESIK